MDWSLRTIILTVLTISHVTIIHGRKTENVDSTIDPNRKSANQIKLELPRWKATPNPYCSLLRTDICGDCKCRDERRLPEKYYCDCRNLSPQRDCLEFRQNGHRVNGAYMVTQNQYKIIETFCDQTTEDGGWTVFQRRFDGSENFHRDWEMYKTGFGEFHLEHWLGNENINTLIVQGLREKGSELRIDMFDWDGSSRSAKYKYFQVGTEMTDFQLNVKDYSGDAGDSLSPHNRMGFTTIDQDHDANRRGNCAQRYYGGWWYANCITSNLNGEYIPLGRPFKTSMGINWKDWGKGRKSLKRTEMKFRRNV